MAALRPRSLPNPKRRPAGPVGFVTLPAGTELFHGTQYDDVEEVDTPAWFTEDAARAWGWATGREGDDDVPQVVVFRVEAPIALAVATTEVLGGDYGKRAVNFFWGNRDALARSMGVADLSGWIVRAGQGADYLEPEVMLLDTSKLRYVRTIRE